MRIQILFLILLCSLPNLLAAEGGESYGASEANVAFSRKSIKSAQRSDFDYLALRDHVGPSGVPLGGIGVGCFDLTPQGSFTRIGLNNTHQVLPAKAGRGSLFSIWTKDRNGVQVRRLQRDPENTFGMQAYKHSTYTGLFPRVELGFDDPSSDKFDTPAHISLKAHSGLVPHNVKDSALPLVWFEVEIEAQQDVEAAVAFSWQDIIGRGIFDPKNVERLAGQIFEDNRYRLVDAPRAWSRLKPVQTRAEKFIGTSWSGIRQFAVEPLRPKKATFQNYTSEVALVAEKTPGVEISALPAYQLTNGEQAWSHFRSSGDFPNSQDSDLSDPASETGASIVSVKTKLAKGEKKRLRFMLAWYFPELLIDRSSAAPGSFWGTGDYGRYFQRYFSSLGELLDYGVTERDRILSETQAWQTPILKSSYPDWLKFKLINSAYPIYTNSILNKAGTYTVMEGAMGGLAGTMDQRLSSHPFVQKFFTELDRSEMQLFANAQGPPGNILHFIGHYYVGMADPGGATFTEKSSLVDNTTSWIIQLARDYTQTGDTSYLLRNLDRVKLGLNYLVKRMKKGVPIPLGGTTYDDFPHPEIYSYLASVYLTTLRACEVIGSAANDSELAKSCGEQFKASQKAMIDLLWNGKFFAYGSKLNGKKRKDNLVFTGQIAGQFVSRLFGWGDILPFPMVQSALETQLVTSVAKSSDFYPDKIWNLTKESGIDKPGSRCWPFYLESYTAMNSIQAGFLEDGLDIMKHIQTVHLREGWSWSQNLWNPGEVTYMTAPVTWFITDVLAGSNVNVSEQTLHLAPIILETSSTTILPVYFPGFWGVIEADSATQQILVRVTKTFGAKPLRFSQVIIEPHGRSSNERHMFSIPEFTATEGAVLDLSRKWKKLIDFKPQARVLPFEPIKPVIGKDSLQYTARGK